MKIRHGDLALARISRLPKGLKESKSKVIMVGSHGHDHFFDTGKLYFKNSGDFVFGYLIAKDTTLFHSEHGKKKIGSLLSLAIKDGNYELRKQQEFTNEGMKSVID